jgi:hypothetical protein
VVDRFIAELEKQYLPIVGKLDYEVMLIEAKKSSGSLEDGMKEQYGMWLSVYSGR